MQVYLRCFRYGYRFGFVGREVRVQTMRQSVPVEAELEETHPRGPMRQGSAARLPALRHEFQAHQPSQQARDPVSTHCVRRQSHQHRVGVHIVHVVVVRPAHTQIAAPVPRRVTHYLRVHLHHGHLVHIPDHIGVAFEKSTSVPILEF